MFKIERAVAIMLSALLALSVAPVGILAAENGITNAQQAEHRYDDVLSETALIKKTSPINKNDGTGGENPAENPYITEDSATEGTEGATSLFAMEAEEVSASAALAGSEIADTQAEYGEEAVSEGAASGEMNENSSADGIDSEGIADGVTAQIPVSEESAGENADGATAQIPVSENEFTEESVSGGETSAYTDPGEADGNYSENENPIADNTEYADSNADYAGQDAEYAAPNADYADQDAEYADPNAEYADQSADYAAPNTGYDNQDAEYAAPNADYDNQDAEYAAPNAGYDNQDVEYVDPNAGYDNQDADYAAPNADYAGQDADYADPNAEYAASGEESPEDTDPEESVQGDAGYSEAEALPEETTEEEHLDSSYAGDVMDGEEVTSDQTAGVSADDGSVEAQPAAGVSADDGSVENQPAEGAAADDESVETLPAVGVTGDDGSVEAQPAAGVSGDDGSVGTQPAEGVSGDDGSVGTQPAEGAAEAAGSEETVPADDIVDETEAIETVPAEDAVDIAEVSGTDGTNNAQNQSDPTAGLTSGTAGTNVEGKPDPEEKTVDERAILTAMSLSLTDKVVMNVFVQADDTVEDDDYIEFSCAGEIVQQSVADAEENQMNMADGESVDVLIFEMPLRMRQMTDDVSFHMVVDGEAGTPITRTVRSYADQILAGSFTDEQKNLTRAMLNCGAYAQEYFEYNVDKPANAGIFQEGSDPVKNGTNPDMSAFEYTMEQSESLLGFQITEATLELKEDISLIIYYKSNWNWTNWFYDISLSNSDKTLENGYDQNKEMYYVKIPHIMPYELNQMFVIEVNSINVFQTNPIARLSYSPLSFCREMIMDESSSAEIKNLCRSLYYYWDAAYEVRKPSEVVYVK